MPLFDSSNPSSVEFATLYAVRETLADCAAMRELLEAADATIAKKLIIPGPMDPPFDGETFKVDELEERICWAQVYPPVEEESTIVAPSRAIGISSKEGFFKFHIHRQVRKAELAEPGGKTDVWSFFGDRVSKMIEEFIDLADSAITNARGLWVPSIKRTKGPMFNPSTDESGQGRFIWCDLVIPWGGGEHAE